MNQWGGPANGVYTQQQQQQQQSQQQQPPQHHMGQPIYTNLGNSQAFDINHYSQTLHNGAASQAGTPQPPSFPNQTFTPAPVIPAKRAHDGMSGSPQQQQQQQQHPSRSQTPSYPGYPNQQQSAGQYANAPTPYQHLQQPGSNNATPSPTMSSQQFRPPPQQQQQQRMSNASPSPYPQSQQGNFNAGQLPPGTPQNQAGHLQQQAQMGQYGQQYGMSPGMSMAMTLPGMQTSTPAQSNNMGGTSSDAHRMYQMKLLQHQQQLRSTGMLPPTARGGQPTQINNYSNAQQGAGQMANGQSATTLQMREQQARRATFMKQIQGYAQAQNRNFNPTPLASGKPIDLWALWTVVIALGGSAQIEHSSQWQAVANRFQLTLPQFPTAAAELRRIHIENIAQYERAYAAAKQNQARAKMQAQQNAAYPAQQQQSPNKTAMQPPSQQNQYQQLQQSQQPQQAAHNTPVQSNAALPQNGTSTPQPPMSGPGGLQHRRNSSLRKAEQMTPLPGAVPASAPSPMSAKQPRPPSAKLEPVHAPMKSEEAQSTNYMPQSRSLDWDGGYDVFALNDLGSSISRALPVVPAVEEMGVIDTKAITLSLASGIHSEVRYALDALVILSNDIRVALNLHHCGDLLDVIIDCAEEQTEDLSEDAVEVSDVLDLPSYEDILRGAKMEAETLQDVPEFGTHAYILDRAANRVAAITTVLRNCSFYEFNHVHLTPQPVIRWLSNTIRLLGTRNMLLRTFYNTQDFYKDVIIFLSNITQSLELPSRDDALHILHFLLAFAPQPPPSYAETGKVRFVSFSPTVHRYLPPAVDCLAKLLARQDPNRALYRTIFTASSTSLAAAEAPLDLLTRAFALAIAVLPDRTHRGSSSAQLRIVEARKAYLTQGMLAADILTTLAPTADDGALARAWIESEDGWAVGLLNLAALLAVDRNQTTTGQAGALKGREIAMDYESFKLITHRALGMMGRLAEAAGKGCLRGVLAQAEQHQRDGVANGEDGKAEDDGRVMRWEGIPQGHAILGALMMPSTDKVALGLLCGLYELATQ